MIFIIAVSNYFSYIIGYGDGAVKSTLYDRLIFASDDISVINDIKEKKYNDALQSLNRSLEYKMGIAENINHMDVSNSPSTPIVIVDNKPLDATDKINYNNKKLNLITRYKKYRDRASGVAGVVGTINDIKPGYISTFKGLSSVLRQYSN